MIYMKLLLHCVFASWIASRREHYHPEGPSIKALIIQTVPQMIMCQYQLNMAAPLQQDRWCFINNEASIQSNYLLLSEHRINMCALHLSYWENIKTPLNLAVFILEINYELSRDHLTFSLHAKVTFVYRLVSPKIFSVMSGFYMLLFTIHDLESDY